ncbi:hypothetical protein V3G39_08675 [Dermatophilaceae bacterium Sec6.4]
MSRNLAGEFAQLLTVGYETLQEHAVDKQIGYARVSTKGQSTDPQDSDLH